jgi:hypothetical protein
LARGSGVGLGARLGHPGAGHGAQPRGARGRAGHRAGATAAWARSWRGVPWRGQGERGGERKQGGARASVRERRGKGKGGGGGQQGREARLVLVGPLVGFSVRVRVFRFSFLISKYIFK